MQSPDFDATYTYEVEKVEKFSHKITKKDNKNKASFTPTYIPSKNISAEKLKEKPLTSKPNVGYKNKIYTDK